MEGLSLLDRARFAGLKVHAEGNQLVIRGRPSHRRLARQLLARKTEVMAELRAEGDQWPVAGSAVVLGLDSFGIRTIEDLFARWSSGSPPDHCYACDGDRWWRLRRVGTAQPGNWVCARCHPPGPPANLIEFADQKRGGDQRA